MKFLQPRLHWGSSHFQLYVFLSSLSFVNTFIGGFTLREIYDKIQRVKEQQATNTPKNDLLTERGAAEQDEQTRFNTACSRSGPALLQTPVGIRLVWYVTSDWWYDCGPDHATASSIPGQNDQTWAALLQQVGEPRHPFFDKPSASRNGKRRR